MGKNLVQQARGKGGPRYRAPSFRYKGDAGFGSIKNGIGQITDLFTSQGHAPLMKVICKDGEEIMVQAPEGVHIGQEITIGENAEVAIGNIMPLKDIPEGSSIFNIEMNPGDGGKLVKSCGAFAKVVSKTKDKISIQINPESPSPQHALVLLINGQGKLVKKTRIRDRSVVLNLQELTQGIYLLRIELENHTYSKRVLLIR